MARGGSKRRRWWRKAVIVGLTVVAVSVACAGTCLSVGAAARLASGGTPGLGVHACAGLVTQPRWQVGVAWYAPLSSYRGPLAYSPYALCADVPWSGTPKHLYGEWLIPR
jgi:hypothetical protein